MACCSPFLMGLQIAVEIFRCTVQVGAGGRREAGECCWRGPGSSETVYMYVTHVQFCVTPWTVACQAPLSVGWSRSEMVVVVKCTAACKHTHTYTSILKTLVWEEAPHFSFISFCFGVTGIKKLTLQQTKHTSLDGFSVGSLIGPLPRCLCLCCVVVDDNVGMGVTEI